MSFDVLSRTLRDAGRMRLSEKTFDAHSRAAEPEAGAAVVAAEVDGPRHL
jgi:hypothetical protein